MAPPLRPVPEPRPTTGTPAKLLRETDSAKANRLNAWTYHRNALAYARGEHRAWIGAEYETWKAKMQRDIEAGRDLQA